MSDTYQFEALARYNSEVARGLVHTEEWKEKMRVQQEKFNEQNRAWAGWTPPEATFNEWDYKNAQVPDE